MCLQVCLREWVGVSDCVCAEIKRAHKVGKPRTIGVSAAKEPGYEPSECLIFFARVRAGLLLRENWA